MSEERGTLRVGEYHPMAPDAMAYIKSIPLPDLMVIQESLASTAIEGNRLAEVCCETLHRVLTGDLVSDRYLLGLAWFIRNMREAKHDD